MKNKWKVLAAGLTAWLLTAAMPFTGMAAENDSDRLVAGTIVNGVQVSNMTVEEAKAYIEGYFNEGYTFTIQDENGKQEVIKGEDISYSAQVTGDMSAVLSQENASGRADGPGGNNYFQVEMTISYDDAALKNALENLSFVREASPTSDAYISPYEEGKAFTIIPEVQGTEADMGKLIANAKVALNAQKSVMKLNEIDYRKEIKVTADSEELNSLCASLNRYKDVNITYVFGDQQEILSGLEIAKWVEGTSDSEIVVNQEKVAEYVKYLADKYDTYGKPHTFTSTSGREVTVNGAYGWQINQAEEMVALTQMVKNCSNQTREPAYTRRAASRSGNDFGNTYVEVDLGAQHLYLYENGTCIVDTPIVSGNVSQGHTTPAGLYTLNYKERNRVLRGPKRADGTYSYESFVSYWMPFNGGIGLHDANWRGSFGGQIYKTSGSHGCVNMPPKVTPTIYEHVYPGIPILCFY